MDRARCTDSPISCHVSEKLARTRGRRRAPISRLRLQRDVCTRNTGPGRGSARCRQGDDDGAPPGGWKSDAHPLRPFPKTNNSPDLTLYLACVAFFSPIFQALLENLYDSHTLQHGRYSSSTRREACLHAICRARFQDLRCPWLSQKHTSICAARSGGPPGIA